MRNVRKKKPVKNNVGLEKTLTFKNMRTSYQVYLLRYISKTFRSDEIELIRFNVHKAKFPLHPFSIIHHKNT